MDPSHNISARISSDDEILYHLTSRRPPYEENLIFYPGFKPVAGLSQLSPRQSFAGELDILPLELLQEIFSSLDFQSLRELRRANSRLKGLVDAYPPWRYMNQHASKTLRALIDNRLITQIDAGQLYAALRSDRCVCCDKYGPLLFLPTCQRSCLNCHDDDARLRVITVSAAAVCFGLKKDQIKLLPMMLAMPTNLPAYLQPSRQWLVSVTRGRETGIKLQWKSEGDGSLRATPNITKEGKV